MHGGSRRLLGQVKAIGLLDLLWQSIFEDPVRSSTGPPMHLKQPGFGHAKEKGPDCRQQRRDLGGNWGRVSQRASASTRTALAAAALAEPPGETLPDGRARLLG